MTRPASIFIIVFQLLSASASLAVGAEKCTTIGTSQANACTALERAASAAKLGPPKDREALAREADARREAETRRREEIQRGFADPSPGKPAVVVQQPEAQPPTLIQSRSAVDRMTTYASVIGRGMACKVPSASRNAARVGAWMNREGLNKEYGMAFLEGIRIAAEQQYRGETPDTCSQVASRFDSFPWP